MIATFPVRASRPDEVASDRMDEPHLLAAIRQGDREAAEEMVDRTYPAVFASICRLCGDPDLASDLTQETYQKAWVALPRFDGRSQLFTWLYRIAYTTFLNSIRRPSRTRSLDEPDAPEIRDASPGIEELIGDREEAEQLRTAVLALPEDLRFTVTAHFWGGLTIREVAVVEGITTVAIRKRLHRAFALLEKEVR